jgi:hypothetical protein
MADDGSKPAIPAWQRAQRSQQGTAGSTASPTSDEQISDVEGEKEELKEIEIPTPVEPAAVAASQELASEGTTPTLQLQHMQTFLEDPAVQAASMEKKRAFFESKGITKEQIDQALRMKSTTLTTNDFESFKQAQPQQAVAPQPPQPKTAASGPPIITYPEFLVEAHKPPPLITPARILTTAYVVSGVAALLYGASKFLVGPMSDSLTEARHDLAMHSQAKIEEMNDRLTTLVSKVPDAGKKDKTLGDEAADDESVTSDPTELYHRDMGTQTSPPDSRTSSLSSGIGAGGERQSPSDHASKVLGILQSHLDEFILRDTRIETANKDKQESMNKLRSYLDGLMYTNTAYGGMWENGVWSNEEKKDDKKKKEEDVVEELKKEIRGVKGVLLSAKRFPGVAGRVGGAV